MTEANPCRIVFVPDLKNNLDLIRKALHKKVPATTGTRVVTCCLRGTEINGLTPEQREELDIFKRAGLDPLAFIFQDETKLMVPSLEYKEAAEFLLDVLDDYRQKVAEEASAKGITQ